MTAASSLRRRLSGTARLFSSDIVRRLGQEEITAGRRAEAVELARVLGAERVRLDRHPTDRITPVFARVGNTEVQPCPLPWRAGGLKRAAGQLSALAHPA